MSLFLLAPIRRSWMQALCLTFGMSLSSGTFATLLALDFDVSIHQRETFHGYLTTDPGWVADEQPATQVFPLRFVVDLGQFNGSRGHVLKTAGRAPTLGTVNTPLDVELDTVLTRWPAVRNAAELELFENMHLLGFNPIQTAFSSGVTIAGYEQGSLGPHWAFIHDSFSRDTVLHYESEQGADMYWERPAPGEDYILTEQDLLDYLEELLRQTAVFDFQQTVTQVHTEYDWEAQPSPERLATHPDGIRYSGTAVLSGVSLVPLPGTLSLFLMAFTALALRGRSDSMWQSKT